jgi:GT2 family glycosyltransferase
MSTNEITIVMVPRERYSGIAKAIETLYEHTENAQFKLVVVDGGLPENVRTFIERESHDRGFMFIHKDYPLTPNEARNIGLKHVKTTYVVFADNDVQFTPNWLPPLVSAAEEFDAWLVGPTILDANTDRIHAAGGESGVEEVDGGRHYHYVPGFMQREVEEVHDQLERGPTTMLEFHVILAHMDVFKKLGPLDEKFSSFADHDDLVYSVLEAGGKAVYEPGSTVSYHDPGTDIHVLQPSDLPMYLLRWGNEWNLACIDHAAVKWRLDPNDPWIEHAKQWTRLRRRNVYPIGGVSGRLVAFTLYHVSQQLGGVLERHFCNRFTKPLKELRIRHGIE